MSLVQPVENGKIVETASQSSMKKTKTSSSNGMDKDAFLQLLVAQMKYQDPLEPTSNTEFISQYAQFSQVEQLQNMASNMDLQRASQLVGQEVRVKTTNSSGDTNYVEGKVDYVAYENGKAYLSIDGNMYAMEDLDTIADAEYLEAYNLALDWVTSMNKLPSVATISIDAAEAIEKLKEAYDGMSDYQKTFVASEKVKDLNAYLERLEQVRKAAEEVANKDEEIDSTDETKDSDTTDEIEASDTVDE